MREGLTPTLPSQGPRTPDVRAELARRDRLLFARRDRGDAGARAQLIERFLPLARSVARRYEHCGEPLDDLVQVASLALIKAIDGYDLDRGCAFSSYAVPTISGELKRYFRDRAWTIRPPRGVQELVMRVECASQDLSAGLDRAPTVRELASAIDGSDEEVLEALQARRGYDALSFHAPTGGTDSEGQLQDTLGSSDDGYAHAEARALLGNLLRGVPPRTRLVLRLRFEQDLTQAEIGALIGLSQMQVSRIIRNGVQELRLLADEQQPGRSSSA